MIRNPAATTTSPNEVPISNTITDVNDQLNSLLTSTLTAEPEAQFQLDPPPDSTMSDASFCQDLLGLMGESSDQDTVELSKGAPESILSLEYHPQPTSSTGSAEPWTHLLSPTGGTDLTLPEDWLSPAAERAGVATCMSASTDQTPPITHKSDETHQASLPRVEFPAAARRMSMPVLGLVMTMADDPARVIRMLAGEPNSRLYRRRNSTGVDGDFPTALASRTSASSANCDSSSNTSSSDGFCTTPEDLTSRMQALPATAWTSSNAVGTADFAPIQAACQLLQEQQLLHQDAETILPLSLAYSASPQLDGQSTTNDLSHLVRNMADLLASMATLARTISSGNSSNNNGVCNQL